MSRTYRKIGDYQQHCLKTELIRLNTGWYIRVPKEPTKKELAVARSDAGCWEHCYTNSSNRWYFNQVSRKTRQVERKQIHKYFKLEDIADWEMEYDFDDSEAVAKRKGIWWDIH